MRRAGRAPGPRPEHTASKQASFEILPHRNPGGDITVQSDSDIRICKNRVYHGTRVGIPTAVLTPRCRFSGYLLALTPARVHGLPEVSNSKRSVQVISDKLYWSGNTALGNTLCDPLNELLTLQKRSKTRTSWGHAAGSWSHRPLAWSSARRP